MQPIELISENNSEVVIFAAVTGTILNLSTSGSAAFGYLPEELIGRNLIDFVHPSALPVLAEALRKAVAAPRITSKVELLIQHKDASRRITECAISNFPRHPGIDSLFISCCDISVSRAARKLERAQFQELLRSNARLEELVYAVAHDLRENFRTISAFATLLLKDGGIHSRGAELARFISGGVARMSSLFESLYSSASQGLEAAPSPVVLDDILAEVLQNLAHIIATSKAVVTATPLPVVRGNSQQLVRVFQNLVVNAIKYRSAEPIRIHVLALPQGPDWMIKVCDNGIGIAAADHERIFRLLNRLHGPELPGSGIGLALCKKSVEGMGGKIWVESEPGAGSSFCFLLTAAESCSIPALARAMGAAN
jgi:PAS domain S-box-containing protein